MNTSDVPLAISCQIFLNADAIFLCPIVRAACGLEFAKFPRFMLTLLVHMTPLFFLHIQIFMGLETIQPTRRADPDIEDSGDHLHVSHVRYVDAPSGLVARQARPTILLGVPSTLELLEGIRKGCFRYFRHCRCLIRYAGY
jgi:hypothetical protein